MLCQNCNSHTHETKVKTRCQVCGFNFTSEVPDKTMYKWKYCIDCKNLHRNIFVQSDQALKTEIKGLLLEMETRVPQGSDAHILLESLLYKMLPCTTYQEVPFALQEVGITITTL